MQPHSGAQANAAAMFALLKPGDTIMGLNLAHGGHLTHGMKINFSGKLYNVVPYHVDETGVVDMEEVERLAKESQPKLIVAAGPPTRASSTSPPSAGSRTRSART